MAIPDYQSLMLPLLRFAEDGIEHLLREAIDRLADDFDLSDAERMQLLPSGATQVFASRVSWARTYLKQAELLSSPRRGALCITPAGTALLTTDPGRVDNKLLNQYAPFRSFQTRSKTQEERKLSLPPSPSSDQTPEDAMAAAYQRIRKSLESDLLEQVRAASPAFLSGWWWTCWLAWATAALVRMQVRRSGKAATAESTE